MQKPLTTHTLPPLPNNNYGAQWEIGGCGWGKMAKILKYVHGNDVKGVNLSPNPTGKLI